MKKRIIAALTALVMVVTMIPANAFASTGYISPEVATAKICKALGIKDQNDADTKIAIKYTDADLAKIEAALADYNNVSQENQKNPDLVKAKAKLDIAVDMFKQYLVKAKAFNDAVAEIKEESLTSAEGIVIGIGAAPNSISAAFEGLNIADTEKAGDTNGRDYTEIIGANKVNLDNLSDTLKSQFTYNKDGKDVVYTTASTDMTAAYNLVKLIFTTTGTDEAETLEAGDKNFAKAVRAINGLRNLEVEKITPANYGALNAAIETVGGNYKTSPTAGDVKLVEFESAPGVYVRDYVYLINGYEKYTAGIDKVNTFDGDRKAIKSAADSLTAGKVDYTKKYTTVPDMAAPLVVTKSENIANVNADNYAEVKALYDSAKAVYDKYNVDKGAFIGTNELSTLKETLVKVVGDEKVLEEDKTLDACKVAMDYKVVIDELYSKVEAKESFTIADYEKFNTIDTTKYASTFTNGSVLDNIDAYLTSDPNVAKNTYTYKKYVKVAEAMKNIHDAYAPNKVGEYYGNKLHEEIAKLPRLQELSKLRHKETVDNILGILNEYAAFAQKKDMTAKPGQLLASGSQTKFAIGADGITVLTGSKIGSTEAATYNTLADLDPYLAKSNMTIDDFQKYVAAVEVVYGSTDLPADANVKIAKTELGKLVTAYETTVKSQILDKPAYDTVKAAEDVYNKAYAALTEDEKAYFNKENKDALSKVKNATRDLRRFEAISDPAVIAACDTVKANIDKMISKAYAQATGKDAAAINKPLIDAVENAFKDENVKYVFETLNIAGDFTTTPAAKQYADQIAKYAKIKAETVTNVESSDAAIKAVEDKITALPAIDNKAKLDEADKAIAALNDAKKAYEALKVPDQYKVKNASKMNSYAADLKAIVVDNIELEMANIFKIVGGKLDAAQVKTVENVDALLAKYAEFLGKDIYNPKAANLADRFVTLFDKTTTNGPTDLYVKAKTILDNADQKAVLDEVKNAYDAIDAGMAKVKDVKSYDVAQIVLDGINAYNALSKDAKALLLDAKINTKKSASGKTMVAKEKVLLDEFLALENKAKSFFLANATVEAIADQQLPEDGSAVTPAVVVKDAMGNVIDAKNYKVEYANNTVAGTAKVIIDAVGTVYTGRVEATFNIVADAATVKPEKVTVKTDQGIIKVTANKVEGLSYRFMVKQEGAKNWKTINTKSNVATFTGLVKNARYEVKVATVLGKEVSEFNNAGFVYTNKLGNKSAMMYKAAINKVTIKKGVAKITAKNVAYKGEKYRVGYKKYGTKNFKWNVWGTNTVKTVKGLKKGVKYTFTIQYRYVSEVSGTYVYSKYSKYVVKKAK